MGETATLLSEVFAQATHKRGVYLFDEFDSIGKHRADDNDVGEARRIVSTFLQLLDADESESILIAATNERGAIDAALFRRFDDVVSFEPPGEDALHALLRLRLASYDFGADAIDRLAHSANGLSHADLTVAVVNAVKAMILDGRKALDPVDVERAIEEIAAQRAS